MKIMCKILSGVRVYLLCMLFTGLFAGQPHWLEPNAGHENMHVVIIDAGSSGSRVLAYTFKVTSKGTTNVELIDEYYQQTEPGLSSYVDQPDKGADSIVQLIHSANTTISAAKRKNTPLIVRATAGLRLLPKDKAEKLIDYVSKAISELGYNVRNNSVEIMDGSDEGIYIWYTINFLHKLIGGETMAALDLGGGSTQITYQLSEEDTKSYPTIDQHVLSTGTNVTVYTHSYLNLGLHAARYGILQLEAGNDSTDKFASVCVHPLVRNASWKYANKQFIISGSPRQGDSENVEIFSRCHAVVKRYVMATLDWEPRQPPRGRVAAMSYFFDVAADAGMIDKLEGGTVSVSQYRARALAACSVSDAEHPWACVDLVFIVTLLQDVYKIQDQDPISLFRQVNGHEVSWALGLAYSTITKVAATESAAMV